VRDQSRPEQAKERKKKEKARNDGGGANRPEIKSVRKRWNNSGKLVASRDTERDREHRAGGE
jgi:hypothetical protein